MKHSKVGQKALVKMVDMLGKSMGKSEYRYPRIMNTQTGEICYISPVRHSLEDGSVAWLDKDGKDIIVDKTIDKKLLEYWSAKYGDYTEAK